MSRHEQDREDFLRDATALVERAELRISAHAEPILIGFRKEGALSLYFGPDHAYHFNSAGQLRRAYIAGTLYKADQSRLIALDRDRGTNETALHSRELSDDATVATLGQLEALLSTLDQALHSTNYSLTGQVPAGAAIIPRLQDWLDTHKDTISIASRPHVR